MQLAPTHKIHYLTAAVYESDFVFILIHGRVYVRTLFILFTNRPRGISPRLVCVCFSTVLIVGHLLISR